MMCHCSMTSPGDLKSRHTNSRFVAARGAPKWGNYRTVTLSDFCYLGFMHDAEFANSVDLCRLVGIIYIALGLACWCSEMKFKMKVKYFILAVRHRVECVNISYQGIKKCPFHNFSKSCQLLSSMADSQFFYSSLKALPSLSSSTSMLNSNHFFHSTSMPYFAGKSTTGRSTCCACSFSMLQSCERPFEQ